MNLPKIDLAMLPDLDVPTRAYGTQEIPNPGHDDTIVILATFLYEAQLPDVTNFF